MARGKNKGQRYDHIYRKLNDLISTESNYTASELIAKYNELKALALKAEPRSNYEKVDQKNLLKIIEFAKE